MELVILQRIFFIIRNSHFIIKELGIDGDIYNAFGIIAKNIFRFNNETKK